MDLAAKLGISQSSYNKIEKGETNLISPHISKICESLQIREIDLLFGYAEESFQKDVLNDDPIKKDYYGNDMVEYALYLETISKYENELKMLSTKNSHLSETILDKQVIIDILKDNSSLQRELIEKLRKELLDTKTESLND